MGARLHFLEARKRKRMKLRANINWVLRTQFIMPDSSAADSVRDACTIVQKHRGTKEQLESKLREPADIIAIEVRPSPWDYPTWIDLFLSLR